jgi:hypothetical protein
LEAVEGYRKEHGESRSQVIASLLASALQAKQQQADLERYVRGYLEQPETDEDHGITDRLAIEAATWDPWP